MRLMWIPRILFVLVWWLCLVAGLRCFGLGGLALVFITGAATAGAIISDAAFIEGEDDSDDDADEE